MHGSNKRAAPPSIAVVCSALLLMDVPVSFFPVCYIFYSFYGVCFLRVCCVHPWRTKGSRKLMFTDSTKVNNHDYKDDSELASSRAM